MKKYTIIFLAVALTAVFAVTAMANEWNLYGNARMATFYTSRDFGDAFTDPITNPSGDDQFGRSSFKDTQWDLQGNSRIGATIKGDMIDARFEYGTGVNLRRLYGVWKFTEGWGLLIGQEYTPITFFLSGQVFDVDAGLLQVGMAYGARFGQITLQGKLGPGELKLGAVSQNTPNLLFQATDPATGTLVTLQTAVESYIPKLEASYQMMFADNMSGHVFGGYQTVKYYIDNFDGTDSSETINSFTFGLGVDLNFGPMFVKSQGSYYRNGAVAGWLGAGSGSLAAYSGLPSSVTSGFASELPSVVNASVNDVNTYMAMLALGFSPTEQLTLEAGIGWLYTNFDAPSGASELDKNTRLEYYLQAVYQMAPGVFLIPEIGYRDFGDIEYTGFAADPKEDLGSLFYFGAKWQINF